MASAARWSPETSPAFQAAIASFKRNADAEKAFTARVDADPVIRRLRKERPPLQHITQYGVGGYHQMMSDLLLPGPYRLRRHINKQIVERIKVLRGAA